MTPELTCWNIFIWDFAQCKKYDDVITFRLDQVLDFLVLSDFEVSSDLSPAAHSYKVLDAI